MTTRATNYGGQHEELRDITKCSHIPEGGTLVPLPGFVRYMRCLVERCLKTYWWDGPSLLPPKDPCRKKSHTSALVELTLDQVDALKRI